MAVNKVNLANGETLVDLTGDSVTAETLAEGTTAHDASGNPIIGKMPTTNVLYTEQTLTEAQKAQARENIGAVSDDETPKVFYITMNPADMTVDKTDAEIEAAYQAGKHLVCRFPDYSMGFLLYINCPLSIRSEGVWIFSMAGLMPGATNPTAGYFVISGGKVQNFDVKSAATLKDIPPKEGLTIWKGTETVYYDGSHPREITIPSETPNPYALTINGTSYDGSKAVNLTIECGSGGESIPGYVRTEAERVAALVQSHQNANTVSFLACSDIHLPISTNSYYTNIKNGLVHAGQAMELLRKQVHIDFAFCGGDLIWDSGESNAAALASMRFVHEVLASGMDGVAFWAEGNHDDGSSSGANLTAAQTFANIGAWNTGAVYNPNDRTGGYCYRDFDNYKVRVICLNTAGGKNNVSQEQCNWLSEALNVKVNDGWRTILLSHCPLDWNNGDEDQNINVMSVIKAATGIICNIHGHTHGYKVGTLAGTNIPRIAIPNISFYRTNEYGELGNTTYGETTTYSKTAGTGNDTAFCVITIDLIEKKIYADHYGAGYDRVTVYDKVVYSVTNNLTNMTSNGETSVEKGATYSATLTANSGYNLTGGVVKVTMVENGTEKDITSSVYSNGNITITSVTGNIVITAFASLEGNAVTYSINTDGSRYNGTGFQEGYRLNSSGMTTTLTDAVNSGFIAYNGEVVRVYGTTSEVVGTTGNYMAMYNSSFAKTLVQDMNGLVNAGATWEEKNGKYMLTVDLAKITNTTVKNALLNAKYIRCSMASCTGADFVVTLNKVI